MSKKKIFQVFCNKCNVIVSKTKPLSPKKFDEKLPYFRESMYMMAKHCISHQDLDLRSEIIDV